jgi:hypothetical protein
MPEVEHPGLRRLQEVGASRSDKKHENDSTHSLTKKSRQIGCLTSILSSKTLKFSRKRLHYDRDIFCTKSSHLTSRRHASMRSPD